MPSISTHKEAYQNHVATLDERGKRVWVYPKKPTGRLHQKRITVAMLLLICLFGAPFLQINGQPFVLLNMFERKFILLGYPFFPQDFYLFGLATLSFFVCIALFTMVFGRVWCGWACPQTIFMEVVFRKIEYWIEGDAKEQKTLDKASWTVDKILKKASKHVIFLLISILIAHLVMAYIIGPLQVLELISQSPANHWAGFLSLVGFTAIFYLVFSRLREQACTVICPYGRLQSVLLTKESMVVIYDFIRGEPRGKLKKQSSKTDGKNESHACTGSCPGCTFKEKVESKGSIADAMLLPRPLKLADIARQGDCIDCKLCVQVCPTGIDIRNGTQLECINCTACMDACHGVMTKIGKPTGLIRWDSYQAIIEKTRWKFTPRIAIYTSILVAIIALQAFLLSNRSPIEATVMRVPGMLYQEQPGNKISNLYNVQLINKTFTDMPITLKLEDKTGGVIKVIGEKIMVPKSASADGVFFIELPKASIITTKTSLTISIYSNGQLVEETKTTFLGPPN